MGLEAALEALIGSESFERLLLRRDRPIQAHVEAGEELLACALATALDSPIMVVTPGPHEAEAFAAGAEAFLGGEVAVLPPWEALPYEGIGPSPEVASRRADAVGRLRAATGPFVLVAPALAAMHRIPPSMGRVPALELVAGRDIGPDALALQLVELGYLRADVVERRGEFAVRGGVLDVFPGTARRPVRLEYDGDTIESLREFSASSQLSTARVSIARVPAVRELVPDESVRARAAKLATRHLDRFRDGLQRIADGISGEEAEILGPMLFDHMPLVAELLPAGSWVMISRAGLTLDRARRTSDEASALAEATGWPGPPALERLEDAFEGRTQLHLSEFTQGTDLGIKGWGSAEGNSAELAKRLRDLAPLGYRVVVTAGAAGSLERARETLSGMTFDAVGSPLRTGFVFAEGKIAVVSEEDLFGSRRHTRSAPRWSRRSTDSVAQELEPGDLAVHRIHGVGRYAGITHRALAGSERDYLILEYAEGDRLFVPTDQVGMVARYLGGDAPRLHRMGGSDWARATSRVKRAVKDMAGELVRLYSVRMSVEGHAFGPDTPWQMELEDAFPHDETADQLTAIEDVKSDMLSPKPMDRLICGDVGFGKTEIAVRAAFKAVMDGTQVAVLVPTTLLAEQHFITFSERFASFPVKVKMLSRFVAPSEQANIAEELASGKIDVVIGTHRLLSRDIRFSNLGLVVVDEEQRFGVAHKERLKKMRAQVDVLTMTATPIPRTLEMALAGIRDLSSIDTPPEDRQPVLTYVGGYDAGLALGAVRRELLREGQVFWVHNRVATIERQAGWLRDQLPDARIVVAHGQMDEGDLEKRMMRFWDRDADVLVCTVIIESGLDVPNANTLVVDSAHTLGLSQMYQLRGRVGRSSERAFAYFFFPQQREMTEEANERLATIARHQALGSGFKIAMRDLEIRGAGNLLGAEQHGHIAAVGFDTYCRLLGESVAEMRGKPVVEEKEIRIELPIKAFVPPGWVAQEALRLDLYRRIGSATDLESLEAVKDEIRDRYGAPPPEVETLFDVAALRVAARSIGIEEISTFRDQVRIRPFVMPEGAEPAGDLSYHPARQTLNLLPRKVSGAELPAWIRDKLLAMAGQVHAGV